jgi:hypothetical protein
MEAAVLILFFLVLLQQAAEAARTHQVQQEDLVCPAVQVVEVLKPLTEREALEIRQVRLQAKATMAEMVLENQGQQKFLEAVVVVLMRLEQQVRQPLVAMVVMVLHRVFLVLL